MTRVGVAVDSERLDAAYEKHMAPCAYCGEFRPSRSRKSCANCGAPRDPEAIRWEIAYRRATSDRFVIP